jgi:hypothetical protein
LQEGGIPYTSPFVSFSEAISIIAQRLGALDAWARDATDRFTAERQVHELRERLRQAAEMAKSTQSAAAVRHHSVTARKLAEAEKQLAVLREAGVPSQPGSLEEAENEFQGALYDGAVSAIGDLGTVDGALQAVQIPSAAWGAGARIERLACALTPPVRGGTYLNVRLRLTDLDKIWPELRPQPEPVVIPPAEPVVTAPASRTGLPGRPTSWHLIEAECRKRYAAGERHPGSKMGTESRAEWARALLKWFKTTQEGAPVPTEKTVVNKLAELLRELAQK